MEIKKLSYNVRYAILIYNHVRILQPLSGICNVCMLSYQIPRKAGFGSEINKGG